MKVKEFIVEDDKVNRGLKILVAVTEDGSKFVVSGNPHFPTQLVPYDECYYSKTN